MFKVTIDELQKFSTQAKKISQYDSIKGALICLVAEMLKLMEMGGDISFKERKCQERIKDKFNF